MRSLFSVALQTVNCKPATPVKKELLEISGKVAFQNIPMHVLDILVELQNANISPVTLTKSG